MLLRFQLVGWIKSNVITERTIIRAATGDADRGVKRYQGFVVTVTPALI